MRSLFVISMLALSLVACGDDDDGTGTPDAGAMDAGSSDAGTDANVGDDAGTDGDLMRDFCEPLADLVCTRAAASECGCGAALPGGEVDVEGCTARFAAQCATSWAPLATGDARVDADAAAECVALIGSSTTGCQLPPATGIVIAHCTPFVYGPAAIDAACTSPLCAEGAGLCAGGTCRARGGAGATCSPEQPFQCAVGLVCRGGECVTPPTSGQPCEENGQCALGLRCVEGMCLMLGAAASACDATSECGEALLCSEGGTCIARDHETCSPEDACGNLQTCRAPRACAPRGVAGATCTESRDCAPALFCSDESRTCVARPTEGQPCAPGNVCALGLGCDMDGGGTCRPLPTAGQPCAYRDGDTPFVCAGDLACVDNECAAAPGEGEPCAFGNVCATGLACDFTREGSFCIVPRVGGGECMSDRSCADAFHCGPENTCVADLPSGSTCRAGNECAGVCVPSASGGFVCADRPDEGETCLFDEDCGDALVCDPVASAARCGGEICAVL
ncbi:Tryptophan synthase alpha chain [Sandaracinus amylolyticus]|uniref:Tryptophan synthase alpha chain n=1 Tax=Sandaracinus amylolyticus TaxID=927083 RepID=A0A0F6SDH8_9BACT|nr:Tryptophan synthase alpha chain [Sandaracinus amylolyticus]